MKNCEEIKNKNLDLKGNIIILNGTSSSGKTTLALALRERLIDVYYLLSLDDFIFMVDLKKRNEDWDNRITEIYSTMNYAIQFFSDLGRNIIVDTVFLDGARGANALSECVNLIKDYPVLFVRVECGIQELERRECTRGDRQIGQARFFNRSICMVIIHMTWLLTHQKH
jgi:chloramphenicol 3-O phosphotransferase